MSFVQPSRYDVVADGAVAGEAVRLPAGLPTGIDTSTGGGARKSRPRSGRSVT
ncbi:hypothetical protein GCM10009601_58990 [Streptomyces thermospinosisporus]|uniref:Uncharacterized protein n=1 Tax=Streptomyces thermospinosisporus TaxID=161482 RepID=A0ABP4JXC1_9ACTN